MKYLLKLKIANILAKKKKGGGLQGDKYISNYNAQFVQLVVDHPDEALAKIKLLFCTFPPESFALNNNIKELCSLF